MFYLKKKKKEHISDFRRHITMPQPLNSTNIELEYL